MKKVILLFFVFVLLPLVLAESQIQTLGTFIKGSDVTLYQSCADCSYNNISYVNYPNMSIIISDISMDKSGVTYSYLLSGNFTQTIGEYTVCGFGDPSSTATTWCYNFFINGTGRADPSGAVLVLFILAFILILVLFAWLFIYTIGHAIKKDFDIMDLGFDFGIYFAILGLYFLQGIYLGLPLMDDILYVLVYVGAFTHVFASSIFFFISLFRANTERAMQQTSGGMR